MTTLPPKRILLISPMPPLIGGVSMSSERLYHRLLISGYDARVFALSFRFEAFNNRWLRMLKLIVAMPFFLLFNRRFDVIHAHLSGGFRHRYVLFCRNLICQKSKLVFTIHRDVSRIMGSSRTLHSLQRADAVICVQKGDSARLSEFGINSVDIPPFVFPGIDKDAVDRLPKEVKEFMLAEEPVILTTGSVVLEEPHYDLYGLESSVDNYLCLKSEGIVCRLLLAITGHLDVHQRAFVKELKEKVNGDSRVMIITDSHLELIPLLTLASVFLRPTSTDGDSLSVRESLSVGCPVIASDVSERPEGTIVYHDTVEFVNLTRSVVLENHRHDSTTSDFFNEIVSVYGHCQF